MNIQNVVRWTVVFALLFFPFSFANAQGDIRPAIYHFDITQGKVAIQPVFCIPARCQGQSGEFAGSFDAVFLKDQIRLSNIVMKSKLDFTLPEDPYTDVNGAVYDARYHFDGQTLVLEGTINSSAFDGPIVQYSLTAKVVPAQVGFDPNGFFLARQDYRKCASPMCGGIFVKSVNHSRMECPDGNLSKECYIGTVDWNKIGFNPFSEIDSEQLLLQGKISNDIRFGRFTASNARSAAGNTRFKGKFYGVENNGLVCISSPCFSFDEYLLNSDRTQALSDIDFSRTGATDKAIEQAYRLMAEGEAIMIVGENRRYRGFSGIGLRLVASQLYLPVKARGHDCPAGYVQGELGCETRNGCLFPLLEQTIYSGVRPDDENLLPPAFECVTHCEEPSIPVGDGYCVLNLP